jgi:sirohydrochlorin ferrochelatase
MAAMNTALLLIAHGSRREEANADLEHLAKELRRRDLYSLIACAYLELAEPDIETAAEQCVVQGAECVLLLPYFLAAGMHVTRDLEAARDRLQSRYLQVRFRLCEPIGLHPLMIDIITERARDAEREP